MTSIGKNLIKASQQLLPSIPRQVARNLHIGVYFSNCPPSTDTDTLRYQLFRFGRSSDDKFVSYVRLRKSDVVNRYPDIRQYNDGRRSFRIKPNKIRCYFLGSNTDLETNNSAKWVSTNEKKMKKTEKDELKKHARQALKHDMKFLIFVKMRQYLST